MSSSQSCAGAVSWTTLMIIFVILSSCRGEEVVKAMQRLFPRLGDNGSVTLLGREGDEEENAPEDLEEEVDDVLYHLFGALLLLSMLGMCGCTIYGFYRRFKEQQAAQPVIPICASPATGNEFPEDGITEMSVFSVENPNDLEEALCIDGGDLDASVE